MWLENLPCTIKKHKKRPRRDTKLSFCFTKNRPFLNSQACVSSKEKQKKRFEKQHHVVVVLRATPTIVVVVQRPRREDLFVCLVIMLDFFFFERRRKKSDFKVLREWSDFKTVGRPEAL